MKKMKKRASDGRPDFIYTIRQRLSKPGLPFRKLSAHSLRNIFPGRTDPPASWAAEEMSFLFIFGLRPAS